MVVEGAGGSEAGQEVDLEDAADMEANAADMLTEVAGTEVTVVAAVAEAVSVVASMEVILMAGTGAELGVVVFESKKKAAVAVAVAAAASGALYSYCFSLKITDFLLLGVVVASAIQAVDSMMALPMDMVLDRVGQARLLPRVAGWRAVDTGIVGTSNVKVLAALMTEKLNDRVIDLKGTLVFLLPFWLHLQAPDCPPALDGMNLSYVTFTFT